jgi:photosystem II stability/assembly factor-like uncharacterized protein
MGRISLLFLGICCFGCFNLPEEQHPASQPDKLPKDILFMQRAFPYGEIKVDAYVDALAWQKTHVANRSTAREWELAGPLNIGGRITDIEIPNDEPGTYYIGAASGGIFKSTNAGESWTPIFDDQPMLSIGDIEISAANSQHIWVGTGEPNAGGGSLAYDGNGLYKSSDGGMTWVHKGLADVGSIAKVKMDPNDDQTLFVAAMGPLFRNDTNRGLFKTTDGGVNWEKVLYLSDSTGVIDLALHPVNSNIIYATTWERIRRPYARKYGGETSGIYRSLDGGETWAELNNGLPDNPLQKGRITIDISKSNPNVLYAGYTDATGNLQGMYRTSDGGNTWSTLNSDDLVNSGFQYWFEGVFIDPTDEDIVYNLGIIVQKSIDGGQSWFDVFTSTHVDHHALAFNPAIPGEVLLGNDGGFYKSADNGETAVKNRTIPITQFYRFHVDAQNANKIYGGAQDNSTMRTTTGGLDDWKIIYGGDGFQPLVDPTNTNVIYALYQYGELGKSINDGTNFSDVKNGIASNDRKNWDTPIAFNPMNSQVLYYGANRLYKTTDGAANWTAISPDLSNGPYNGNLVYGTIISISVSPLDSQIIYAGTDDGNVWVTQNGGEDWTNISQDLPNRWVTKVLADRDNPDDVYVTFSGYRYGEDFGHIFKSTDAGLSWEDISGNLPDVPVNDIEKDAWGNLFVATDIGVLSSYDDGLSWEPLGFGMPSVVVTDLHMHEPSETMYAATYGRSAYKIDISGNILNTGNLNTLNDIRLYPNPASESVTLSIPSFTSDYVINIFDQTGRKVFTKKCSNAGIVHQVPLDNFTSGIYFVSIKAGEKQVIKKLLVH